MAKKLFAKEKEKFVVPRSLQQSIPIRRIYRGGLWQVGLGYSKSWSFTDINYAVASDDDQLRMFMDHCAVINAMDSDAGIKMNIIKRRMNPKEFAQDVLYPLLGDQLDSYRREINGILEDSAAVSNNMKKDLLFTVTASKRSPEEARAYFNRVGNDVSANFKRLSSTTTELENDDRLRLLHDFFRSGEEQDFRFDLSETMRKGHDFRDYICPDSLEFKKDHFTMGNKFGRVIYLKEYPSYLKDTMLAEMTELPRNMVVSLDIKPIPTDEAVKEMQKRMLGVETEITKWQQKQNMNNNFSVEPPYEFQQMRAETKEFLDDLTTRDQRMMFGLLTIVHVADTKEQLDEDTGTLLSIGRKHLCQFAILRHQQEDGLNTALPYGLCRLPGWRTLTTESVGIMLPYSAQEILHPDGVYMGVNAVSHNLIMCNRASLINGHGIISGVSGGGKSFAAKGEMLMKMMKNNNHRYVIIDPEREYGPLGRAVGAQIIVLSAGSSTHINALDMAEGYGDGENPIILKSEFVMSLCEQLMGANKLGAKEKSIIDRSVSAVYREYVRTYAGEPPTLVSLYDELVRQPEPEAREIALAMELFTTGSLNLFAHQSNVDLSSRVIIFDTHELAQLKTIGNLVMLEHIMSTISKNRKENRRTHVYIDELHLFFAPGNEYSGNFLQGCWRRARKMNAEMTGISQQVEDLLGSDMARAMFANSEFLLMLNQSATDRRELAKLLNISDTQLSYITNSEVGHGLIKVGPSLVPFVNRFPRNTAMYRLMSTKPGEG